jgi:hypothetical protein
VTHTCNPSYEKQRSEGWQVTASPGEIVHETLSPKKKIKPSQKRAGRVAQGVGPEFKSQCCKKKKKKKKLQEPTSVL